MLLHGSNMLKTLQMIRLSFANKLLL